MAEPGVKNFSQVSPVIYRGGQPDRDGWFSLKEMGVRTVVCLRWNKSKILSERKIMDELGLTFISIPLTYWDWPNRKDIDYFLSIVDDPDMQPIFIHCLHGSDRTGLVVAIYRMSRQGWEPDRAYQEMRDHGFHRVWMYHFKWALYDFARKIRDTNQHKRPSGP